MSKEVFSLDFYGRKLIVETGEIAKQADGSCIVKMDDCVVLCTVCGAKEAKLGQDFFPLTVNYYERQYAVGKIPGSFLDLVLLLVLLCVFLLLRREKPVLQVLMLLVKQEKVLPSTLWL